MKWLIGGALAAGIGAAVWFWTKQKPVTVVKFEPEPKLPPMIEGPTGELPTTSRALPPPSLLGPVAPKAVTGVAAPDVNVRAEILLEEWATS